MAQLPITEGIFTFPAESPQLIGSRCADCGTVTFPTQASCARCGGAQMDQHLLPRRGTLWAWTIQDFPPPSPPYSGATGEEFQPFGIGYVALGDEVKVETRLTVADPEALKTGMEMELVLEPFRTDADGNEVVTFAFAPAG